MLQNLKGTKDILPDDISIWQEIEEVFRTVPKRYGYKEIRTPVMENATLFLRGVGEGTDVVSKEMYTFPNKTQKYTIALRPELTAPVARAILQYNMLRAHPTLRVWYYGPAFRYEEPQEGRQRQFHQIGAECLGSPHPEADAEVITLANDIIRSSGISQYTLNINTLGTPDERAAYRTQLTEYLQAHHSELSQDSQRRMEKNPLRTLDSKDARDKAVTKNAPSILDCLGEESKAHFISVQELLKAAGVSFVVNPGLVRGLDYYMHTVFEFRTDQLGSQDALGGGGRYDNLFADIGGKPTPGVGFGLGVERLILLASKTRQTTERGCDVLLVSTPEYLPELVALSSTLRAHAISVTMDLQRRSFKAQFREADKTGAKAVIVLGEDEITNNTLSIKNMATKEQLSVQRSDEGWIETIQSIIAG